MCKTLSLLQSLHHQLKELISVSEAVTLLVMFYQAWKNKGYANSILKDLILISRRS
uniref:Uncharacterized protein n=1 Tax=Medicago truncatula TaxID=3880 RepID=I3SJL7_MEDTR|nr:unknown [Medicago truncatula]